MWITKRITLSKIILTFMILVIILPSINVNASTNLKLVYDGKTINYTKSTVGFSLNGKKIDLGKTPGIVISDTSMGYYKDIFVDDLDAECIYNKEEKKLTLTKYENTVELTLNKKTAYVNGKKKSLDVPMKKVKYKKEGITRLMVPVRFVAENLGYKYEWSSKTKTGIITSDWIEYECNGERKKYSGIKVKSSFNGEDIAYGKMPGMLLEGTSMVNAKKVFSKTLGLDYNYDKKNKILTLKNDEKTVVFTMGRKEVAVNGEIVEVGNAPIEIKNIENSVYYVMVPARYTAEVFGYTYIWNNTTRTSEIYEIKENEIPNDYASVITGASIYIRLPEVVSESSITTKDMYWSNKFSITIDGDFVNFMNEYPIVINNKEVKKYTISLTSKGKTKVTFYTSRLQGYEIEVLGDVLVLNVGEPKDIYENIVVLDCGHGGQDPGAIGGEYKEKDLNYSILYTYAKKYFDKSTSNVKAYWTRHDDTFISLSDRASFANKVGADMFISLHMNSATPSAKGTEVYYSSSNNKKQKNGLTSKIMADMLVDNLVSELGTYDRGTKSANYTVIYKNTVPAVLIELGFISNASDRALLADKSFQKDAAKIIYETVEEIFDNYPTDR